MLRSLTELVAAIEGGSEQAWAELVHRLEPTIRSTARRYRVDEELRNDAVGEVWRILFERLDTVEDPERLHGWIAVVTRNQMASMLRRSVHRCETTEVNDIIEVMAGVEDPDSVVGREMAEVLGRAVARLTPREQTVIRCRAWTDSPESLESMEQRHGIPAGSIGPTLGRGLRKLRRDPQLVRFLA